MALTPAAEAVDVPLAVAVASGTLTPLAVDVPDADPTPDTMLPPGATPITRLAPVAEPTTAAVAALTADALPVPEARPAPVGGVDAAIGAAPIGDEPIGP